MPSNNFSKILLAAVEESLSSLGESSKHAIFYHLENSFEIEKERIPENLTKFADALEKIFGPGASYLEKLITQQLHEKLGLDLEDESHKSFLESVDSARKRLEAEAEGITQ